MSSCFGQTSQWHIPVRVHDAAVLLSSRRNPFSKLSNMLIQHGILFACFPVVNVLQHECSFLTIKNPKSKKVCRRISSSFLLSQVSWSVGSKFCIRKMLCMICPFEKSRYQNCRLDLSGSMLEFVSVFPLQLRFPVRKQKLKS